jgi:hypothetical protein
MAKYNAVIYTDDRTPPNIYRIRFYNAPTMVMSHEQTHILLTELEEILSKFPNLMGGETTTHGSFTKPLRTKRGATAIMLDNLTKQDFDALITYTKAIKSRRQLGGSRRLVKKSHKTRRLRNLYTHSTGYGLI